MSHYFKSVNNSCDNFMYIILGLNYYRVINENNIKAELTESKIFFLVCNTNLVAFTYVIRYDVFKSVQFTRTIMISYLITILTKLQKFSVKGLFMYTWSCYKKINYLFAILTRFNSIFIFILFQLHDQTVRTLPPYYVEHHRFLGFYCRFNFWIIIEIKQNP